MRIVAILLAAFTATACFHVVKPRQPVPDAPTESFSHATWAKVLSARVNDDGLIDYKGLQGDRSDLDAYVAQLASASPDSHPDLFKDDEAKLAYWINAYNALAVTAVIDRPGLGTVVDNKVSFFYSTKYPLGTTNISLYTLENSVVRGRFDDPRIHFALNCQSASCPDFPNTPFPADGLNETLEAATKEFMADSDNVRLNGDTVEISQILEWYAEDFESAGGSYAYVRKYRPELPKDAKVTYIPYDWTLIAQEGRRP